MSGWIKLEKDLPGSFRFRRMVRAFSNGASPDVTVTAVMLETMLLGALVRFWFYADTHINDEDCFEATHEEIDEHVGVPGFAMAMPADWLVQVSETMVKLPGFLDHNGSSASERKRAAKRQAESRNRRRSTTPSRTVTGSHKQDQTRLEKTKTRKEGREDARARDANVHAEGNGSPQPPDTYALTARVKAIYPAGMFGDQNWILAEREIGHRLDEGVTAEALTDAAAKYCEQQRAMGKLGSAFIRSPEKFYGAGFWRGPFPTPVASQSAPPKRMRTALEIAEALDPNNTALSAP